MDKVTIYQRLAATPQEPIWENIDEAATKAGGIRGAPLSVDAHVYLFPNHSAAEAFIKKWELVMKMQNALLHHHTSG